ncbi:hypothetical protein [Paenibacillus pabuli]|uniref:hypothetical protein n=1 Tax=Paenibacillus pabuli TaxID=1472 RepID=UPI001FFE9068|nr:hypothetical protein [Paenibacillus pabuli]UPK46593.1 hypothetical protein KET34_14675 [Paenibacillus pabuli]
MKKKLLILTFVALFSLPTAMFASGNENSFSSINMDNKVEIQGLLQKDVSVVLYFPKSSYTKDMVPLKTTYYEGAYGGVVTRTGLVQEYGSNWGALYQGTIYKEM